MRQHSLGERRVAPAPSPTSRKCPPLPIFLALLLVFVSWGCGVPASQYCYTAASATIHAVDIGMNVAGDLYREGKINETVKAKLVAAHDVYRPVAKGVVDGCRVLKTSEDKQADEMIKRIQMAGAHVIEALTAAGVK